MSEQERENVAYGDDLGTLGPESVQPTGAGPRRIQEPHGRMERLLDAILAISSELELTQALHTIVEVSAGLVDARYGALGVLDENGEFTDLVTYGVDDGVADAIGRMPTAHGLLAELVSRRHPMRVDDVTAHPAFRGYPTGHPVMHSLLGVPVLVRGTVYGNMYFADKRGGGPFTGDDERLIAALASAAGVAIENARLYERLRRSAETFQRSLLPHLPDMHGLRACARYRPSSAVPPIGGDWYDVVMLPDGVACLVVGDVMGHDVRSAVVMSQISNMLRVIAWEQCSPPSRILDRLDEVLHALHGGPMATVLLARLEEHGDREWLLRWSSAGHPPPLLVTEDGTASYLRAEGGHPLGVAPELPRPDHTRILPSHSTLLFYTDGLVEEPAEVIDKGMADLAAAASALCDLSLEEMADRLLAHRGDRFGDDVALLALRLDEPVSLRS
ncbi:PP2C family protein-serine/threonine phosphatase [Nonomuraea sp. NPDC049309]|uniref:PP2C family protein-serine/threonine phosphatase n=1 Tax=Nonomuraea sp. NPDC049309 TaxID=3364350 RepID=UPI00371F7DDA